MKKLFAIGIVVCLAVAASAALQLEVAGGKAMVTGQLDQDLYLILTAGDGATLSNFALGAAAPLASIGEKQGTAADFAAVGVPIPSGYDGEAWYLASFPGEAYKTGVMLTANFQLTKSVQVTEWEESYMHSDGYYCWGFMRYWLKTADFFQGTLALYSFSDVTMTGKLVVEKVLDSTVTKTLTFFDGPYINFPCPEPATLALLGLGMAMIRRRNST